MPDSSRSVTVRLSLDTAQALAASKEFGREVTAGLNQAETAAQRTGRAVDDLGNKAGKLALGGAAALGLITKAAMDWESAWAGVTKTVDGSAQEMSALEDGLRDLAKTLPATHEEIAGVAEAAGQLGVAREDIVDFTRTMVDLGETTNLTADQAATDIAQISNVMGTAGEDVDNLGAALVALGNDGASTEAQILGMAQRIAGAGAQIGLAESDILAIANAAASMGIEVEAGGSAVSRVFTSMAKATAQGGEKLETFAQVAGVSAAEFAAAFEEDPARAFASFTEGLDRINKSGGDVFTTLDQLKLSDVRVSQALLGMAASGDLLSDSLDLGAKAWEENTALAEEAAKRYATTASQTQIAWNKITDAGIEAGETLLPVVGEIADKVGMVADAFGQLPDPVQNSAVELLAIGTITAGATWLGAKTIGAVTSLKGSLTGLTAESTKSSRALSGLAKAGVALLALEGAGAILDGIAAAAAESAPGVERLTEALLTNVDAQIIADNYAQLGEALNSMDPDFLDGLGDELEQLASKGGSIGTALGAGIANVVGLGGAFAKAQVDSRSLENQLTSLDQALASIASAGGAEAAEDAFERFAAAQGLSADQQKELLRLLPAYDEALAANANSATLAADAEEEVATSTRKAGRGMAYTAEQIEAATEAYNEQVDAAHDVAGGFVNIGDKVDDAKVSLGQWLRSLERQAEALRNFRINAQEAAKKGLDEGLIRSLQEAGPAGALRMRQLADATEAEIKRANRAWREGQRQVDLYVDATTKVPKELRTTVTVEKAQAEAAITSLEARLRSINDEDVFINVRHRQVGAGTPGGDFGPTTSADGSTVPKTGRGYRDRHLYLLADGEEVVSNRYGQADRHRPLLKAINANRMAIGGTAGGGASVNTNLSKDELERYREEREKFIEAARDMREAIADAVRGIGITVETGSADMRDALKSLEKDVRRSGGTWTAAMDKQSAQLFRAAEAQEALNAQIATTQAGLDDLNSQRSSLVGSTSGALTSSLGGGGLAGLTRTLTADRDRALQLQDLTTQLGAAGLDTSGALFQELASKGDVTTLRQLLASGTGGIDQVEALYADRGREVGGFANRLGDLGFKDAIDAQTAELARLQSDAIDVATRLVAELADVRREARDLIPPRIGKHVGDEINSAAAQAAQTQSANRSGSGGGRHPWSR